MTSICINIILAFATSLLGLLLFRSHLMSALLCMEGMMPSLFVLSSLLVLNNHLILTAMLLIILLVFAASEVDVGSALLVMVSNTYHLDYV